MKILQQNNDKLFQIFETSGRFFMTVLSGGVSQFGITIELEKGEAADLVDDPPYAERLATKITASPESFEDRRVRPSINV